VGIKPLSLYLKIILIIFGLAYLISPVDIIPDLLLPYIGWIDDGVIIGTIIYLIRYGKLPNFFFKKKGSVKPKKFTTGKQTNEQTDHQNSGQSNEQTGKYEKQNKTSFKTTTQTPYEILGINPNASKKEINLAYKEAIKKYHPDKLSHLGEEFADLANEKFLAIQKAHDTLMGK
jgi:hypothetical protein